MMKAGRYWVGDLCYVLDVDDQWDEVCDLFFETENGGEFELENGIKFTMYNTAFGDGTYRDEDDKEYWVDSGSIGAVLVSDVPSSESATGGHIFEFTEDFFMEDCNGLLNFVNARTGERFMAIDTDPEYDEGDDWIEDIDEESEEDEI